MSVGHSPTIGDTGILWVNFVLYLVVMGLILRKPVSRFWVDRRNRIDTAIRYSQSTLGSAQEKLAAAEHQMLSLTQDIDKLRQQIKREADQEAALVVSQARSASARLAERAKQTLDQERRSAISLLRTKVIGEVMQLTETKVRGELSPERDRRLRESGLTNIEGLVH